MKVASKRGLVGVVLAIIVVWFGLGSSEAADSCTVLYNSVEKLWNELNNYEAMRDSGRLDDAKSLWPGVREAYSNYADTWSQLMERDQNFVSGCDTKTRDYDADVDARYQIDALRTGTIALTENNVRRAYLTVSLLNGYVRNGFYEPRLDDLKQHLRRFFIVLQLQIPDDLM